MNAPPFWRHLAALGARKDDPPEERRRLSVANQGAAIEAISCGAFAVGYFLSGPGFRLLAASSASVALCQVVALALARGGRRTLAKVMVLLPVHALVLMAALRLGLSAGVHAYFFLLVAVSFLVFGDQERILRALFAMLSVGSAAFVCAFAPVEGGGSGLTPMGARRLDVVSAVAVAVTIIVIVDLFATDTTRAEASLAESHAQSERLLLNILPASISARLKDNDAAIADGFAEVTVLFADLVGFTELSQQLTPAALVDMLNHVFSAFDDLAEKLGLEKIKTIGDCYMVAAGLPTARPDHAEATAMMALGMRDALARINRERGYTLKLRIGLHTGPVIAGVIGKRKFIYDLWGDTVNTASRMESSGIDNQIQVTRAVHDKLEGKFDLEPRGTIKVKGKGELETFFLRGKLP